MPRNRPGKRLSGEWLAERKLDVDTRRRHETRPPTKAPHLRPAPAWRQTAGRTVNRQVESSRSRAEPSSSPYELRLTDPTVAPAGPASACAPHTRNRATTALGSDTRPLNSSQRHAIRSPSRNRIHQKGWGRRRVMDCATVTNQEAQPAANTPTTQRLLPPSALAVPYS